MAWLTRQLWGALEVVVHDDVFHPAELPGFIAERWAASRASSRSRCGRGVLEIVTINALDVGQGSERLLIERCAARRARWVP